MPSTCSPCCRCHSLTALSVAGQPHGGYVRAWLWRTARNRCIDLLKRRKDGRAGKGTLFAESAFTSSRTGPSTAFARGETEERIRAHLAELPEDQSEVLMLFYFDGLRRREIAQVLDLGEPAVKHRLFEARQALRRTIGEE